MIGVFHNFHISTNIHHFNYQIDLILHLADCFLSNICNTSRSCCDVPLSQKRVNHSRFIYIFKGFVLFHQKIFSLNKVSPFSIRGSRWKFWKLAHLLVKLAPYLVRDNLGMVLVERKPQQRGIKTGGSKI